MTAATPTRLEMVQMSQRAPQHPFAGRSNPIVFAVTDPRMRKFETRERIWRQVGRSVLAIGAGFFLGATGLLSIILKGGM